MKPTPMARRDALDDIIWSLSVDRFLVDFETLLNPTHSSDCWQLYEYARERETHHRILHSKVQSIDRRAETRDMLDTFVDHYYSIRRKYGMAGTVLFELFEQKKMTEIIFGKVFYARE